MKAGRWFFHEPGYVYALDMAFDKEMDEREARSAIRDWLGVRRLPRGMAVWPATKGSPGWTGG